MSGRNDVTSDSEFIPIEIHNVTSEQPGPHSWEARIAAAVKAERDRCAGIVTKYIGKVYGADYVLEELYKAIMEPPNDSRAGGTT